MRSIHSIINPSGRACVSLLHYAISRLADGRIHGNSAQQGPLAIRCMICYGNKAHLRLNFTELTKEVLLPRSLGLGLVSVKICINRRLYNDG